MAINEQDIQDIVRSVLKNMVTASDTSKPAGTDKKDRKSVV